MKTNHHYQYIWKWSRNKETPDNWVMATPVKILGYCIGWKIKVANKGFEHEYFTNCRPQ
jgi:hypothetical protein